MDELPSISGIRERWGRTSSTSACHGWEVRETAGRCARHQSDVHAPGGLFAKLTSDLVLFTHTAPPLTEEQLAELAARDVRIVHGVVQKLEVKDDRLVGVQLEDGTRVAREALAVAPRVVAQSDVLAHLGLQPSDHPTGGEFVAATDPSVRTAIPGVWVAGNVSNLSATVVTAQAKA